MYYQFNQKQEIPMESIYRTSAIFHIIIVISSLITFGLLIPMEADGLSLFIVFIPAIISTLATVSFYKRSINYCNISVIISLVSYGFVGMLFLIWLVYSSFIPVGYQFLFICGIILYTIALIVSLQALQKMNKQPQLQEIENLKMQYEAQIQQLQQASQQQQQQQQVVYQFPIQQQNSANYQQYQNQNPDVQIQIENAKQNHA